MAQLQFKEVDTPSFSSAVDLLQLARNSFGNLGTAAEKAMAEFKGIQKNNALKPIYQRILESKGPLEAEAIMKEQGLTNNPLIDFEDITKLNTYGNATYARKESDLNRKNLNYTNQARNAIYGANSGQEIDNILSGLDFTQVGSNSGALTDFTTSTLQQKKNLEEQLLAQRVSDAFRREDYASAEALRNQPTNFINSASATSSIDSMLNSQYQHLADVYADKINKQLYTLGAGKDEVGSLVEGKTPLYNEIASLPDPAKSKLFKAFPGLQAFYKDAHSLGVLNDTVLIGNNPTTNNVLTQEQIDAYKPNPANFVTSKFLKTNNTSPEKFLQDFENQAGIKFNYSDLTETGYQLPGMGEASGGVYNINSNLPYSLDPQEILKGFKEDKDYIKKNNITSLDQLPVVPHPFDPNISSEEYRNNQRLRFVFEHPEIANQFESYLGDFYTKHSTNKTSFTLGSSISKALRSGNVTAFTLNNGNTIFRTGKQNEVNNNPLNIKSNKYTYTNQIGDAGSFKVFDSPISGIAAADKLLFKDAGYKDLTLDKALAKWAPKADGNNTDAYTKTVINSVNGLNKKMNEYTPTQRRKILLTMAQLEGWDKEKLYEFSPYFTSGDYSHLDEDAHLIEVGNSNKELTKLVAKDPELLSKALDQYRAGKQLIQSDIFKSREEMSSLAAKFGMSITDIESLLADPTGKGKAKTPEEYIKDIESYSKAVQSTVDLGEAYKYLVQDRGMDYGLASILIKNNPKNPLWHNITSLDSKMNATDLDSIKLRLNGKNGSMYSLGTILQEFDPKFSKYARSKNELTKFDSNITLLTKLQKDLKIAEEKHDIDAQDLITQKINILLNRANDSMKKSNTDF